MCIHTLRKYYEKFIEGPFSFYKILDQTIKADLDKQDITFLLGYVQDKEFSIYNYVEKEWITIKVEENIGIEAELRGLSSLEDTSLEYCKCIGQTCCVKMYAYIALSNRFNGIDNSYIHIICENYFHWLANYLSYAAKAVMGSKDLMVNSLEKEKQAFFRSCADSFHKYMQNIYQIDLDIVTGIAGTYYESSSCCSQMAFMLSDVENEEIPPGITFQEPIEVNIKNVRKIRKLLQMGKDNTCLWIYRDCENQVWKVKGLYEQKELKSSYIMFHMLQHMVWQMDMGERIVVRYKCGIYLVESEELEILRIEKKFRKVFKKESTRKMNNVFRAALKQQQGTMLVILDNNRGKTEEEVIRLLKDSTGIGIFPIALSSAFIQNATSIDGAVVIDQTGKCYGIGMILDGESSQGNPERGARYNSALKYIKKCKNLKLKGMAIVVSEDKTIDIHVTEE